MADDDYEPIAFPDPSSDNTPEEPKPKPEKRSADSASKSASASASSNSRGPGSSSMPAGQSSAPASWQGKRVANFRIIGFLGRGAMASVFRAEDLRLKRHVALKVFPTVINQGKKPVRLERFIREARSAAALDHPGIVKVYEAGEYKGWYYIAMELVEGGPLGRLVESAGPFDAARAGQIGAEVGEALEYAHDHGIIHRDVKPDNILLARGGRAKLVDFGLAFRSDPSDRFHVIDEAVGTAYFMAPEICRGDGASAQSDQYALAGTMWALLTGQPPYPGNTRAEVMEQHLNSPVPSLKKLRPDLPQGLCAAIEKGLAKQPEDRFMIVEQFAKVLRVYTIGGSASSSGTGAPIVGAEKRAKTPRQPMMASQKKKLMFAAAGVGAVVLIGVIIAAMSGGDDASESQPQLSNPVAVALPTPATRPAEPTPKPAVATPEPAATPNATAAKPALTPIVTSTVVERHLYADFADKSRGKFEYIPTSSGSTVGVLATSTNTVDQDPTRGWVQKLTILDDPEKTKAPENPDGWFVRHTSGQRSSRNENLARPAKGWIGFWAKTETPNMRIAIAIDNSTDVTADRGIKQPILSDGQWHHYQWNLEDNSFWQRWLNGDGLIDTPDFTIDSIHIWGPNGDAVLMLDDITHNTKGTIAPSDGRAEAARNSATTTPAR